MVGPRVDHGLQAELAAALVQAQTAVQAAVKDGRAGDGGGPKFKYVTAAAIKAVARVALNEAGLALVPKPGELAELVQVQCRPHAWWPYRDGPQLEGPGLDLVRTYLLVHASGQSAEFCARAPYIPRRGSDASKDLAACVAVLERELLKSLLLVPVEESVEEEAERPRGARDQRRAQHAWRAARAQGAGSSGEPLDPELEQAKTQLRALMRANYLGLKDEPEKWERTMQCTLPAWFREELERRRSGGQRSLELHEVRELVQLFEARAGDEEQVAQDRGARPEAPATGEASDE